MTERKNMTELPLELWAVQLRLDDRDTRRLIRAGKMHIRVGSRVVTWRIARVSVKYGLVCNWRGEWFEANGIACVDDIIPF